MAPLWKVPKGGQMHVLIDIEYHLALAQVIDVHHCPFGPARCAEGMMVWIVQQLAVA